MTGKITRITTITPHFPRTKAMEAGSKNKTRHKIEYAEQVKKEIHTAIGEMVVAIGQGQFKQVAEYWLREFHSMGFNRGKGQDN